MPDGAQSHGATREAISRELLRIHEETYGKGAGRATTMMDEDTVVVMLDDLELQHNEEFLVRSGEGQAVIDVRGRYQQAIEATFRAAVERETGRRVTSFASITKLEPHYIVEIFRLGPRVELSDQEARRDGGAGGGA